MQKLKVLAKVLLNTLKLNIFMAINSFKMKFYFAKKLPFSNISFYSHPLISSLIATSLATHKEEKGKFMILINGHHKGKERGNHFTLHTNFTFYIIFTFCFTCSSFLWKHVQISTNTYTIEGVWPIHKTFTKRKLFSS